MADLFSILGQAGAFKAIPQAADRSIAINPKAQAAAAAPPKQDFWGNLGHSVAQLPGAIGGAVAHSLADGFTGLAHGAMTNIGIQHQQNNLDSRNQQLQAKQDALIKAYHTQQIDKGTYQKGLKDLLGHGTQLSADASKVANAQRYGYGQAAIDAAKAGGTAATLLSPLADAGLVAEGAVGARAALGTAAKAVPGVQKVNDVVAGGLAAGKSLGPGNGIPGAAMAVAGKVARNALVTQPVVQMPGQVASDVKTGNVGDLAVQAGTLLAPAAAGVAGRFISKVAPEVRTAMFGRQGFFDTVKAAGGPDFLSHLDSLPPRQQKGATDLLRKVQDYNLQQFGGDAKKAGHYYVESLKADNVDPAKLSPQEAMTHLKNWVSANEKIAKAHEAGNVFSAADGKAVELTGNQRLIAGRFNQQDAKNLAAKLSAVADTAEARQAALQDMKRGGAAFGKNQYLYNRLHTIVASPTWKQEMGQVTKLRSLYVNDAKFRLPQGYFPTISENTRAGFKAAKDTSALDRGVAPGRLLGPVGHGLVKAGLSPEATSNYQVRGALHTALNNQLAKANLPGDAKDILNKLNSVDKTGAIDVRNLSKNDIKGALGTAFPSERIGDLQKALKGAYADLPKSLIGLGPSVLNKAIKNVPGLSTYLRAESIGRYEVNPFFRIKQYIKSGIVAGAEGAKLGVMASRDDERALQDAGLFDARGSRYGGDATLAGNLTDSGSRKLMDPVLQKMVGGLAASIAKAHNTTVRDILTENGDLAKEMKQSLSLVTSYGTKGYLNSPLAKTLNLIIFPSRFEAKVGMEAAKAFSKASPITQVALVNGLANTKKYLDSSEGQKWQRDNAELIGLLKAFSPLQTVENVGNFFSKGGHIGDLGELGGLPAGIFTTILEHQGIDLGPLGTSQYTDPRTGQPVAEKIPNTDKARLQQGFTDLLGSMYSFPGRNAGLNSKTSLTQQAFPMLKPNAKEVTATLKGGTPAPKASAPASTNRIPAVVKGSTPVIKPVAVRPVYGAKKTPKPKVLAKRRGTGGF